MSATKSTAASAGLAETAAQTTDWFSMACNILAPGTRHHNTNTVAIDWDAFDRLAGHGWEYQAWTVDPVTSKQVPDGMPGKLHEQRSRRLPDGSTVTCFPPSSGERPSLMLCPACAGRGWTLVTDHENGDPHQLDCEQCDQTGKVPRPFSPLPDGMVIEDFTGPAPENPETSPW